jgi:predicted 2-oxoglutarate/Fe(II)-dependent dioxygenase YbiX
MRFLRLFHSVSSLSAETSKSLKIEGILTNFASLVQINNFSWLEGSSHVPHDQQTLFVRPNLQALDFPFPSQESLQQLYESAVPASFGLGKKTVLDPNYRSARTLATDNFAINLRPDAALLDQIQELMVKSSTNNNEEDVDQSYVQAELYRVNIYGPGDFFKEHQDTPQTSGKGHFGSLVYCLSTEFEGGAFVIRSPKGEEKRFDWAAKFAASKSASTTTTAANVEFVAFLSDLPHWIEPVTSGYRVTVTFHLFQEQIKQSTKTQKLLDDKQSSTDPMSRGIFEVCESSEEMKNLLALKVSKKLKGKMVIFPAQHQYAAEKREDVLLKGGDAVLFRMLKKAGLNPKVCFNIYKDYEEYVDEPTRKKRGTKKFDLNAADGDVTELVKTISTIDSELPRSKYTYLADEVDFFTDEHDIYYGEETLLDRISGRFEAIWARPSPSTKLLSVAGYYGNEVGLTAYYGNVCIRTKW